jgi:uncharacterized SAM-dependent methyltransferase
VKYYKNTELAKIYSVSEKTVRNWVDSAYAHKLDLELQEVNGKFYVANTSKNNAAVEQLVQKGKKYKNSRGLKTVQPLPQFYSLYNPKQILDIISNIDIYREIPLQYNYFNSGATKWDEYIKTQPNSLTNTIELVNLNQDYIDQLLSDYAKVNIIDIGVGNGMPVKELVSHFLETDKLKRYIAIDISKELVNIAEENFRQWFGNKVNFEGYIRDIDHERFDDLLVTESFDNQDGKVANLVLFFGGTISNFRQPSHPLTTIHDSMGRNDFLIFTKKLDSEKSRRYFDFAGNTSMAIDLVLDHLNISKDAYTIEQFFDEKRMARQVQAKLNIALSIEFELEGRSRVVDLQKGESLLLLRVQHQNTMDTLTQFDSNGFELVQASRSQDQDYLLLMTRIKTRAAG